MKTPTLNRSDSVWTSRVTVQCGQTTLSTAKALNTGMSTLAGQDSGWTHPGARGGKIMVILFHYIFVRFFSWASTSKMNDVYTKKNQRRVVTNLLEGVTKIEGETIIETSSKAKDYFAKGHLAPDANFVYEVLQDATYYFINVAPQVRGSCPCFHQTQVPSFNRSTGATGRLLNWMLQILPQGEN